MSDRKINIALIVLLALSALLRGCIAGLIEFGNDEVYYLTYAKFPDLSHFDHPPVVGLAIQLFTLNLAYDSEFFIRLAAVAFGTLSTLMMFLIGKQIKGALAGLYAAIMFTASFYGAILCGTFILPDAPQVFFWLLTLFLLLKSFSSPDQKPAGKWIFLLAAVTAGLAFLSKYHSIFLVSGVFCYLLFHRRKWFLQKQTWFGLLLFLLLCVPVFLWNLRNDFVSFTFHESRISITSSGFQPQYLLTELAGQFFYNNPVNVLLILLAMMAVIRGVHFMDKTPLRIILWISLPLILVFTSFSFFRSTLPHWSGPGYTGLLLITASWLADGRSRKSRKRIIPWPLAISLVVMLTIVVVGVGQIRYGWIPSDGLKQKDVSRDMAGWRQMGDKFSKLAAQDEQEQRMQKSSPILTFRWFPAANFDYYAGTPIHKPVYALGSLERIHKYYWINSFRGSLQQGTNAYYIALSDDYEDPAVLYGSMFKTILPPDTLYITRGKDTIRKAFVYRMMALKRKMDFSTEIK